MTRGGGGSVVDAIRVLFERVVLLPTVRLSGSETIGGLLSLTVRLSGSKGAVLLRLSLGRKQGNCQIQLLVIRVVGWSDGQQRC